MTPPVTRRAATAAPLLVALALFAVPRLALLTRYPPWQDELWTIGVLQRDFPSMLRWIVADETHPPLFYVLAWTWRRLGDDSLWWMRLLPALIGIGTAVPLLALCREARLEARETLLAVALCAASPWLVFYSLELRDYGLYAALAAGSLAIWMRARNAAGDDPARWRSLAAVNTALVYAHYFGWLVIAAEGVDAWFTSPRRMRPFLRSSAWTALAFAPWVALVARRAVRHPRGLEMVAWIPRPALADALDPYRAALGASPWIGADLAIVVLAGGAIAWGTLRMRRSTLPLVLGATVPVVVTFVASVTAARSPWVVRYLLAVAVPFLVLLAVGLCAVVPVRARPHALAFALWPAGIGAWHAARRDDKVPYDEIVRGIAERDPSTHDASATLTPVYALDFQEGGPLAWSAARASTRVDVSTLPSVDSVRAPRAWIVWNEARPPAGATPAARLIRQGYRVEQEFFTLGMDDSVVAIAVARRR